MTTRIGDLSHQTRLADVMGSTRSRVRDLETDVATGKQVRRYAEIPQETALLLRTRDQIATNGNFLAQNERLNDELQAMDGALGSIVSVAERLRTLLVQRLNDPSGDDMPLGIESATLTEEVAAQLNATSHDRYLFSGTSTDTKPVILPAGPITTADPGLYYQGDDLNRSGWLERDVKVDVLVRADDPAFADLFAALGMTLTGHQANSRPMLENALAKADQALAGVIELRSTVGATAARVQDVAEVQRSAALYLDETRGRIEDTDTSAAMTRMAQDKVAIEASYLIVSQISNLSLADYLR
ncbi:MAG TPA: flagellin [Geminicoccus sp.]|jgi:flagellar hook-associated protein 3 FlgL|uniref:flagellin n=1 Tax=Geminicoccus sp. TaxID=2024832 RepID=UPI002E3076E4|nr:flagellin [Geminicoccus sp.]HEX2525844.1 flagellin [Geminicoccus sp.]